tara:strand:+ start:779 stop:1870 length:1092 start_codon:yes stop_codon:yes gene_type:complete
MRYFIAILLLLGGGLAAIATTWFFLQTSEDISSLDQSEVAVINESEISEVLSEEIESAEEPEAPLYLPTIDVARIGPDGSAVFAGLADKGSKIILSEGDSILTESGANNDGEWVAVIDQPLSSGKHLIIAEMVRGDGSSQRAERAILIELFTDKNETPLVALVPMNDSALAELLQAPASLAQETILNSEPAKPLADPAAPAVDDVLVTAPKIYIDTLSWVEKTNLRIKGSAKGGRTVTGALGSILFGPVEISDAGEWEIMIDSTSLDQSAVMLSAVLLDETSNEIARAGFKVAPAQLDIGRDGSEMVVIQKGDVLWRIAYRNYGNGIRYLDIVKRNKARIDNPDLIYPSQIFALPKQKGETQQ